MSFCSEVWNWRLLLPVFTLLEDYLSPFILAMLPCLDSVMDCEPNCWERCSFRRRSFVSCGAGIDSVGFVFLWCLKNLNIHTELKHLQNSWCTKHLLNRETEDRPKIEMYLSSLLLHLYVFSIKIQFAFCVQRMRCSFWKMNVQNYWWDKLSPHFALLEN